MGPTYWYIAVAKTSEFDHGNTTWHTHDQAFRNDKERDQQRKNCIEHVESRCKEGVRYVRTITVSGVCVHYHTRILPHSTGCSVQALRACAPPWWHRILPWMHKPGMQWCGFLQANPPSQSKSPPQTMQQSMHVSRHL